MTRLLGKWAELEPSRCRTSAVGAHLGPPFAFVAHWPMLTPDPVNLAVILAAVIEAIEARGWRFRITSGEPRQDEYHAIVWTLGAEPYTRTYRPSFDATGPTPAAALLTAYLAALEGQASQ